MNSRILETPNLKNEFSDWLNNTDEYLLYKITQYQFCNDNTRSHDTGSVVVWVWYFYKPYNII